MRPALRGQGYIPMELWIRTFMTATNIICVEGRGAQCAVARRAVYFYVHF